MNDEIKLGSIFLVVSCFLWFYAIPYTIKGFEQALFPSGLVIVLTILSGLLLVKGIRLLKTAENQPSSAFLDWSSARSLFVVPMMVVYVFLIDIVGFYAITCVFIIVFMVYFGSRKLLSLLLFSSLLPLIIYLIIRRVLSFPFPAGLLF